MGSSGALPVPLGAYVVVSKPGGCMTNILSELKVIFKFLTIVKAQTTMVMPL